MLQTFMRSRGCHLPATADHIARLLILKDCRKGAKLRYNDRQLQQSGLGFRGDDSALATHRLGGFAEDQQLQDGGHKQAGGDLGKGVVWEQQVVGNDVEHVQGVALPSCSTR